MTPILAAFFLQVQPPLDLDNALSQASIEQAAGNRAKAIALYQRILAAPTPTDPESLKKHRGQLSEAQWQMAVCLEGEASHREALEAYQKAEASPPGSFCGNAITEFKVMMLMGQGRCLESLNRHEEAVAAYFKGAMDRLNGVNHAAVWRIADLYEAAGRTESLVKILDRRDQQFMPGINPELRAVYMKHRNPNTHIRRLIEAREAARHEKWGTLVDLLDAQGSLFLSLPAHRTPNVVTAAHTLAARPEKAVPLLQAKLDAELENDRCWLYYALGLCGTPEAVKTLKERALGLSRQKYKDLKQWDLQNVCYALDLSEPGRAVLTEFSSSDIEHFKFAVVDVYKKSVPLNQERTDGFPPISKDLRLN